MLLRREGDSAARSDYINASYIRPHDDEERPKWIVAQGPMERTVPDFWQMVDKTLSLLPE